MNDPTPLRRLDVRAFARRNGSASGAIALALLDRLATETVASTNTAAIQVEWHVQAELRSDASGQTQPWLLCEASVTLPLACQRCLEGVEIPIATHQWFRFVDTEEQAEAEDELADEDVLALAGPIDVFQFIEDDLLMALPPVVKHAQCEPSGSTEAKDADFDQAGAAKRNPFAQLGELPALRKGRGELSD